MPLSKKITQELEDEKTKIREFLYKKRNNEEPYYRAEEIGKGLNLKHFDVSDIDDYLSLKPPLIKRMVYKRTNYFRHH